MFNYFPHWSRHPQMGGHGIYLLMKERIYNDVQEGTALKNSGKEQTWWFVPPSNLCELMAEYLVLTVVHLILFYENRLKDHHLVIPSVLQGLRALVSSPFLYYISYEPFSSEFSLCPLGVKLQVLRSRYPNVELS